LKTAKNSYHSLKADCAPGIAQKLLDVAAALQMNDVSQKSKLKGSEVEGPKPHSFRVVELGLENNIGFTLSRQVLYHLSHSASPQSSLNEGFWVLIE
jgi:dihydrodipicolinate reductase